ncbi:MAG: glycosyltransferase family 2 protein [Bryobacteraceae bacterium]
MNRPDTPEAAHGLTPPSAKALFPHSLSVFFPAYNDSPSLPGLIVKTFEVLEANVADFEVIVVNDGSEDDTAPVLAALQAQFGERLRVVHHLENRGYGGALRTGFATAAKEFVFYTDGDAQYDVGEIPSLLREVRPEVGLVNGYKVKRHDPWHRIAIGWMYNRFARFLFRVKLRDIDCDYRLIRRSLLAGGEGLTSTSGTICVELVKKLELSGTGIVEVPVSHYPRWHGRSQFFRVRSLAATFSQLCRLYSRTVIAPLFGRN